MNPSSNTSGIWYFISTLIFILIILFGQKIQVWIWLEEIARGLRKLEQYLAEAKKRLIKQFNKFGSNLQELERRIDELLDFFYIEPVTIEPFGIIRRLEHLIDSYRDKLQNFVKYYAPKASRHILKNLEGMLEAAISLNTLYKIVRHYAILGRKTKSVYLIMQLEMLLPLILRNARAFYRAIKAFEKGLPIGDSVGPLTISKLLLEAKKVRIEDDTVIAEVPYKGRILLIVKAEGPGSEVGKPGRIIEKVVEEYNGKIARIIMIDAAMKLEGEKSGEVVEGVGAAIGDVGPEKIRIEEVAARYNIPVDAIAIKVALEEAIDIMNKTLAKASEIALNKVLKIVDERTKEGDIVIIAGIGNSVGIAQPG